MAEVINKLKDEIVRLEKLKDYYLKLKGKTIDTQLKSIASLHEKMTGENLEFLYLLLRNLDIEWDGKIFYNLDYEENV